MASTSEGIMYIKTDRRVRISENDPKVSFAEWCIFKMKNNLPCKVIKELRCRPLRDDDFCMRCYRGEAA